jgi:TonB family protein
MRVLKHALKMSRVMKLLDVFRAKSFERDMNDEIRFHLEERVRQNLAQNMTPDQARRVAHERFGSIERAKAGMRAARVTPRVELAAVCTVVLLLLLGVSLNRWIERNRVYELNDRITAPVPIVAPKPGYPAAARRAKIQGVVRLQCVILANGGCSDPTVLRSLDKAHGLDDEAVRTMRRWRFKSALLESEPVAVRISVDMKFALR